MHTYSKPCMWARMHIAWTSRLAFATVCNVFGCYKDFMWEKMRKRADVFIFISELRSWTAVCFKLTKCCQQCWSQNPAFFFCHTCHAKKTPCKREFWGKSLIDLLDTCAPAAIVKTYKVPIALSFKECCYLSFPGNYPQQSIENLFLSISLTVRNTPLAKRAAQKGNRKKHKNEIFTVYFSEYLSHSGMLEFPSTGLRNQIAQFERLIWFRRVPE